jgi:hypothetical protein
MTNRTVVDRLARVFPVRRLVLAATIAPAVFVSAGQGEELKIGDLVAKLFAIPDGGESPDIKLKGTTVSLIGKDDSEKFGVSYRGILDPEVEIKAGSDKKLVAYFYVNCDNESPSKTKGVLVGSVAIADIKAGRKAYTLIATVETEAFVPLKNVECVKVGVP